MIGLPGPNLGLTESSRIDSGADCGVLDRIDFAEQQLNVGIVGHAGICRDGTTWR